MAGRKLEVCWMLMWRKDCNKCLSQQREWLAVAWSPVGSVRVRVSYNTGMSFTTVNTEGCNQSALDALNRANCHWSLCEVASVL